MAMPSPSSPHLSPLFESTKSLSSLSCLSSALDIINTNIPSTPSTPSLVELGLKVFDIVRPHLENLLSFPLSSLRPRTLHQPSPSSNTIAGSSAASSGAGDESRSSPSSSLSISISPPSRCSLRGGGGGGKEEEEDDEMSQVEDEAGSTGVLAIQGNCAQLATSQQVIPNLSRDQFSLFLPKYANLKARFLPTMFCSMKAFDKGRPWAKLDEELRDPEGRETRFGTTGKEKYSIRFPFGIDSQGKSCKRWVIPGSIQDMAIYKFLPETYTEYEDFQLEATLLDVTINLYVIPESGFSRHLTLDRHRFRPRLEGMEEEDRAVLKHFRQEHNILPHPEGIIDVFLWGEHFVADPREYGDGRISEILTSEVLSTLRHSSGKIQSLDEVGMILTDGQEVTFPNYESFELKVLLGLPSENSDEEVDQLEDSFDLSTDSTSRFLSQGASSIVHETSYELADDDPSASNTASDLKHGLSPTASDDESPPGKRRKDESEQISIDIEPTESRSEEPGGVSASSNPVVDAHAHLSSKDSSSGSMLKSKATAGSSKAQELSNPLSHLDELPEAEQILLLGVVASDIDIVDEAERAAEKAQTSTKGPTELELLVRQDMKRIKEMLGKFDESVPFEMRQDFEALLRDEVLPDLHQQATSQTFRDFTLEGFKFLVHPERRSFLLSLLSTRYEDNHQRFAVKTYEELKSSGGASRIDTSLLVALDRKKDGRRENLTYFGQALAGNDDGQNTLMVTCAQRAASDLKANRTGSNYAIAFTQYVANVKAVLNLLEEERYIEASAQTLEIEYNGLSKGAWQNRDYLYRHCREIGRMQHWQKISYGDCEKPLSDEEEVVPANVTFYDFGQGLPDDPRSLDAVREAVNTALTGSISHFSPRWRAYINEKGLPFPKMHPQRIGGTVLPPVIDSVMITEGRDRVEEFRMRIALARNGGLALFVQRVHVTDSDNPGRFQARLDLPMATVLGISRAVLTLSVGCARRVLNIQSAVEPEEVSRIKLHLSPGPTGANNISFSFSGKTVAVSDLFGNNFAPSNTLKTWELQLRLSELKPEYGGTGESTLIASLEEELEKLIYVVQPDRRKIRNDQSIRENMKSGLGLSVKFKINSRKVKAPQGVDKGRYDSFSVIVPPSDEFAILANPNGATKSLEKLDNVNDELCIALKTKVDDDTTWQDAVRAEHGKKNDSPHTIGFLRRDQSHEWNFHCPSAGVTFPAHAVFVSPSAVFGHALTSEVWMEFKRDYEYVERMVKAESGEEVEVFSDDVDDDEYLTDVERRIKMEREKKKENSRKVTERNLKKKAQAAAKPLTTTKSDSDSDSSSDDPSHQSTVTSKRKPAPFKSSSASKGKASTSTSSSSKSKSKSTTSTSSKSKTASSSSRPSTTKPSSNSKSINSTSKPSALASFLKKPIPKK